MDTPDSPRTRPASTDTAEPYEPGQQPPGQLSPTSLDPRLTWPRPVPGQPARGPRSVPRRMPRFTPGHEAAPPAGRAPVPPPPPVSWGTRPQPMRAVIGDEIRVPFIWCEFGTCDATYTHPDALGERDLRARALAAGWRYDALGRRACPSCAQHDPTFWTARPPAPVAGDWRRVG
jgi:hypothetical protein